MAAEASDDLSSFPDFSVLSSAFLSLFEAEGHDTGIDLDRMMRISEECERVLGRPLDSKVARAGLLPRRAA